jgi:hypothetical protein
LAGSIAARRNCAHGVCVASRAFRVVDVPWRITVYLCPCETS